MNAPLTPVAEDLWIATAPVRIVGMRLSSTMTVIRLADGGLLLHSPIVMTDELRAAVESRGPVAHLYAPNTFHHLRLGEWSTAFPTARVHAPHDLAGKRPDLRIDRTHGTEEPAFAGELDELIVDGFRLQECVLFHRPTRTLVVADLVHQIGRPSGAWTQLYSRTMGFYDRIALSRMLRWVAFTDRAAARRSIDKILALPFERIVVGHGAPVEAAAHEALAAAYAWLPPA